LAPLRFVLPVLLEPLLDARVVLRAAVDLVPEDLRVPELLRLEDFDAALERLALLVCVLPATVEPPLPLQAVAP
jgi:hypothetical protein